jgi:hypothetical protein
MLLHLIHFDSIIRDISLCLAVSYSDSYMLHNILYRYHISRGRQDVLLNQNTAFVFCISHVLSTKQQ